MLALPKGPYEKPSPRFYKGLKKIREHTIDQDEDVDLRDWFFQLEFRGHTILIMVVDFTSTDEIVENTVSKMSTP